MNSALGKVVTAVMIDEMIPIILFNQIVMGKRIDYRKAKVLKNYTLVDRYAALFMKMRTTNYR